MKSLILLSLTLVASTIIAFARQPGESPTTPEANAGPRGLGLTKAEAIEVCGPKGERAYLTRLRCPDGKRSAFERRGSVGFRNEVVTKEDEMAAQEQTMNDDPVRAGAKDFHMLDSYEVRCSDKKTELFLDMYHCTAGQPASAPPGFTLGK